MEGRRIEGVFLEASILRNRAQEAYETARVYELQILSRISQALLASLGGPGTRLRATVRDANPQRIILLLENGYEVSAENRLNLPVRVGEELSLVVESRDPLILRLEGSFQGIRGLKELLGRVLREGIVPLRSTALKESLEDSGIFYERKVWDHLRGALPADRLSADQKFLILKALAEADLSPAVDRLGKLSLPPEFAGRLKDLLELAESGNRLDFLKGLLSLERELTSTLSTRERQLQNLRTSVERVADSLMESLRREMERLGLRVLFRREIFGGIATNPRSLSIYREALRSLELNRWTEFSERLNLLGIRIENRELLPLVKDSLLSHMRDMLRGALTVLGNETGTEDPLQLAAQIRELEEEVENLSAAKRAFSELPQEVRENLSRLESLTYLQTYLLATAGRRFVLPFTMEDRRGVLGFSLEDLFRVFVKLDLGGSYLGIVLEAPRREKPEHVDLIFRTDSEELARALEREEGALRGNLEEIGLELRRFEVVLQTEESFDEEFLSEFGGEGMFNLRV